MSSLSLPRVLGQQRKTSLELERENFEKFQTTSITKAVNQIENPVKEKHVRISIIGTFRDKNAELFWNTILRLPLQENRIVAWKFCHVLHKLLREGHPQVIPYSLRYKDRIGDLGKLWGHLREGYGKLIQHYSQLLLVKLDFHQKNPGFPGNLQLTSEELERIGENDINNYFQMSVEMFDYMDEVLALQSAIFGSLDMSRSNSMTSSGQCRLAPLIQCIQDSSQLYDYCVKILFKLHAQISPDILTGHRQRFLKQFHQLRQFYLASSTLQYFKNLIQIPLLPENPPNILVQAELNTYVTPVVIMPELDIPDGSSHSSNELIDISNDSSQNCSRSVSPDLIAQRDSLIEHLQTELSEYQSALIQLKRKVLTVEDQLHQKEYELSKQREENNTRIKHLKDEASKCNEYEEKAKLLEDKFNKLKEVYSKLREEHIQLIRQKAGIEKALRGSDQMTKFARAANNLIISIKADVDKQLANVKNIDFEINERTKLEEELLTLQATADAAAEQNEDLMCKMEWTMQEKSLLESKLQDALNVRIELEEQQKQFEDKVHLNTRNLYDCCRKILQKTIADMQNSKFSSITCSPQCLENVKEDLLLCIENKDMRPVTLVHLTSVYLILGKAVSNTMPDIETSDRMVNMSVEIGEECLKIIKNFEENESSSSYDRSVFRNKICDLVNLGSSTQNGNSLDTLSDLVETELSMMDKAIEEAASRIEEMLKASKQIDSGIKLEVNGKILDSCTDLMNAIRILVQKSRVLQGEIVASGKSSSNGCLKEFYKRNHQWTEGLISAAKAVGMGAQYLLTAADDVVTGNGKLERLIVASQGVAASTAQLVVASRVKADRHSPNLSALSVASKNVTNATGNIVATVKSCSQLVEETEDYDFSGLSLHQAKQFEMDSQVRVLELESGLEKERLRLAALRRYHYQLAGDAQQS